MLNKILHFVLRCLKKAGRLVADETIVFGTNNGIFTFNLNFKNLYRNAKTATA